METPEYQKLALRTLSPAWAPQKVDLIALDELSINLVERTKVLDAVKKALFYPTAPEFGYTRGHSWPADQVEQNILHAIIGVVTEGGELLEAIIGLRHGRAVDKINLREEIGDTLWYLALLCDALGTTLGAEMQANINKLSARYPEKFSAHLALNRDLAKERDVLEEATEAYEALRTRDGSL